MYCKLVTVSFGPFIEIDVLVDGTPTLSPNEWRTRAVTQLNRTITEAFNKG